MNYYFMHTHCNQNDYDIYVYDERGEIVEVKYKIQTLSKFEDIASSIKQKYDGKGICKFENGIKPKCFQ